MKKAFIFTFTLFIFSNLTSQNKLQIVSNNFENDIIISENNIEIFYLNGKIEKGKYKVKQKKSQEKITIISSKNTKRLISLNSLKKIIVQKDKAIELYPIVCAKNSVSDETIKRLGVKIFNGKNIELYSVWISAFDLITEDRWGLPRSAQSFSNYLFAKKKDDNILYNIGKRSSKGQKKLKKRLKKYFYNCPNLVEKIVKKEMEGASKLKVPLFVDIKENINLSNLN